VKYVGVDVGGTNIAAGAVSAEGEVTLKKTISARAFREGSLIMKDIADLCRDVMSEDGGEFAYIGVGVPGAVETETGVSRKMANINLDDLPIRDELEKMTGFRVFLANDADCAALGENVNGAARGSGMSVTVTLGTGVGCGVIIDGTILKSSFSNGGEAGHQVIEYGGRQCGCGRRGCWERYASVTALIYDSNEAIKRAPSSALAKLARRGGGRVTGRLAFEAAAAGDPTAISVIDNYLRYVACGVTNLINIFDPEIVVIGGGVSEQGDVIIEPIKKYVAKDVYGGILRAKIVTAALGNDAGLVGAAMLGRHRLGRL
jgi:glucokinase